MTMPLARSSRLTALLLGGLLGLALSPAAPARDDTPAEIAARTNPVTLEPRDVRYYARQFRGKCARCHGPDGAGGGEEAAEQAVPPANFTDAAFMSTRSDGQLFYQILMGGGERCAMPAFGPESSHGWSEDKIWHMVAFVRRFAAPPSE
jgi:mono/diheme cytochrome c family protein